MDEKVRIEALEQDLRQTKEELQEILLQMRTYVMEARSPIPNDLNKERIQEELRDERG